MLKIELAGIPIGIENRYAYLETFCQEYLTDKNPLFTVEVYEDEIKKDEDLVKGVYSKGYIESICAYRKICRILPLYDAFLFHSAAVEYEKKAYLFSAPSGTGKSTHIRLWKERYGDEIRIINGDKPILKYEDGGFYVYGTPFAGKEGWQRNVRFPLEGLCFLERGEKNSIIRLSGKDASDLMFKQILFPKEQDALLQTMKLLNLLTQKCNKIFFMKCNISKEAAECSFEALTNDYSTSTKIF